MDLGGGRAYGRECYCGRGTLKNFPTNVMCHELSPLLSNEHEQAGTDVASVEIHPARCCISTFAFPISSSDPSSMPAIWFLAFLVAIISSSSFN